ncbi:MAG: trigger factor [Clostridiales bacterium]|nr:trigger factor [Clostridiales bacterium]
MRVLSKNELEHSQVQFEIRVDGEEFQKGLDAAFRLVSPKLNLPGFRKGKAPRNLVMRTYGIGILFDDAVQETYLPAYEQAILEAGIEPIDHPEVSVLNIDETGYTFSATVTKKPAVKLGAYKNLSAPKAQVQVSDEEVEKEVQSLRARNARLLDIQDRPVQSGDIVLIDYEGKLDGVPFEGGSAAGQNLTIGSGTFIPGFEEQLIGHGVGETFDINVTFPEGYPMEELAGKPTVFTISLHAIKQNELPELDDEFAKDVSESYATVEELRAGLRQALVEYHGNEAEQKFEDALLGQVVENLAVELPPVMLERQMDGMLEDFDKRLQQQGLSVDGYIEMLQTDRATFRESFRDPAEHNIKVSLALEEIVRQEDIEVSEEEYRAEVAKLAERIGGVEVDNIIEMVDRAGMVREIAIRKALDLIKASATATEPVDEEPAEKAGKKPKKAGANAEPKEEAEASAEEKAQDKPKRARKASAKETADEEPPAEDKAD